MPYANLVYRTLRAGTSRHQCRCHAILGQDVGPWLIEKVGIEERHVMAPEQVTSHLVVAAVQQALELPVSTPGDLGSHHRRHRHARLFESGHGLGGARQTQRYQRRRL
ncbi:hypothetical protein [Candidatus Amarobacter glycogenicus]|uniref:hypothetical protein n=1 Tax=Candidatus Amarobacter glycogenicus TaxID=3140699 RepID=UPI0031CC882B